MMNKLFLTILFITIWILSCPFTLNGQANLSVLSDTNTTVLHIDLGEVDDIYFNTAYNEISSMLGGEDSLSIKRAVFLTEWAYLEGKLDYNTFCDSIDTTVAKLREFIKINNLERYKTAGNFALFEYFTKPCPLNGNRPFLYDFEDFTGDIDCRKLFVTKVIETHTGQCTSLPLYYKILSDELGAESFLALAPHHMYIKHIDEYDRWVNIELTNGHFSTDAYMISSMSISAEAIKNKVYLDALSQKESVAMLLSNLAAVYKKKYDYDDFTLRCNEKTLEYFPHYMHALFMKFNTLQKIGLAYIDKFGQAPSDFMDNNYQEFKSIQQTIENFGYREITRENYEEWVRTIDEEKKEVTQIQ